MPSDLVGAPLVSVVGVESGQVQAHLQQARRRRFGSRSPFPEVLNQIPLSYQS